MLHALKPATGSKKARKRVGRGSSSGTGTTAGRGTKGQAARSKVRMGFEGGQTPLLRRQPKLGGFTNPNRVDYEVVNVGSLEEKLSAGKYDVAALKNAHVVRTGKRVKLLSRGDVKKKFDVTVHAASKAAVEAIEKVGGKVTILN